MGASEAAAQEVVGVVNAEVARSIGSDDRYTTSHAFQNWYAETLPQGGVQE